MSQLPTAADTLAAVSPPDGINGWYSTILLSKALGQLGYLLETVELLTGRVAKCRLDGDDRDDLARIARTTNALVADLKEQIAQNTAILNPVQ